MGRDGQFQTTSVRPQPHYMRTNQQRNYGVRDKAQFDLPLLLPDLPDAVDACVGRLIDRLRPRAGVDEVHVQPATGEAPAKLCIHYDPQILSLATIRNEVRAAGAEIAQQFGHVPWQVDGTLHTRRARTIGDRLAGLPAIPGRFNPAGGVRVEFERAKITENQIAEALAEMGLALTQPGIAPVDARLHVAEGLAEAEHEHAHEGPFGANGELYFALASGALLATGVAIEKLWVDAPAWLSPTCYIAAYGFGGFFTVREAFDNLRLKRFEIDMLMLVAAAGAAALGAWAEGALLLFLFSLGHALEHYAMGRAKRAIEALAELAPRTALVRRGNGSMVEIGVEQLAVGDVVIVKPDERIAADGFVIEGTSAVNQAPVTGESIPVDKHAVPDRAKARANPDQLDAASRAVRIGSTGSNPSR